MKQTNRRTVWLTHLDITLFTLLVIFLAGVVITSGMANIQTDAIDYYAIVQRLTGDSEPIVPNLPFVEQRSPGYPLLTLPAYYALKLTTFWITPETVNVPPSTTPPNGSKASEKELLPSQPLLFKDIFFKNFTIPPFGTTFQWNIIAAMLLTGYGLFFTGLFVSRKTLAQLYPAPIGMSLITLIVFTASIFMHNLVNTPAYATLTVFGVSSLFTYFWVKGWKASSTRDQFLAGLFAGLMVLVRLETILIVIVLLATLILSREFRFLRNFILGGLIPVALLLFYNATQFGNPFHTGILKGDINQIKFDVSYITDVLVNPQSGILLSSMLTVFGIVGLFLTHTPSLKALGWAALALITLVAVRVPAMYFCVGQGFLTIGGLNITCPPDSSAMLELIRFDSNRYIIPLMPFAVLGLRALLEKIIAVFGNRRLSAVSNKSN